MRVHRHFTCDNNSFHSYQFCVLLEYCMIGLASALELALIQALIWALVPSPTKKNYYTMFTSSQPCLILSVSLKIHHLK